MDAVIEQINSMGRAFVDFAWPMLWQSGVLIAILLALDFILRRKVRAVFRYWLWMLVFIKLVLPTTLSSPVSVGQLIGEPIAAISITENNQPVGGDISSVPSLPSKTTNPANPVEASVAPHAIVPIQNPSTAATVSVIWQGGVFIVWLAIVAAMVLLLLQRAMFVRGLVRQAKEANDLMKDILGFCCKTMDVRGFVGLKVSPNAASPAVCGLFRPVILLPHGIGSNLGSGGLRVVLMHELAHIKRGDLLVNLMQTLLQIAYFYNPLLWLANWVIRRVREQAVDEKVQVALGEKAQQYPETLLNVARLAFERPALSLRLIGVVESKGALAGRIKRMLNQPIPKTAKLGIIGSLVVILFAAILLPMAKATPPPEFVIKGAITDAQTGKPIAGAKVGDAERYAGGEHGAVTDSNGKYSYQTWYEEHDVKTEADGYKRQEKLLRTKFLGSEKETVIDFALEPGAKTDVRIEALQLIDFRIASSEFLDGDSITITELAGSAGIIKPVHTYTVKGRYTLKSHDKAMLHIYATNGEVKSAQGPPVKRGEGEFSRTFTLLKDGDLHLSFYPAKGGNGFGGVYFAQKGTEIEEASRPAAGKIDVAVEDFDIQPYPEGGLYSLRASIRNKGESTSPEFRLYFYKNDTDRKKPMNHGAGPIKPGDVWNEGSMPFALNEGTNELAVVLDPDNSIGESDRTNNEASLEVVIKDGRIVEKKVSISSAKDEIAAGNYSNVTVQEGVGFDGFIVGDPNCTGEFIKSKLGEPDEEKKDVQQGWWIAYSKKYGMDFWLYLEKRPDMLKSTLCEIRLNKGFKGKLVSEISMSSAKQDVFKIYGEPILQENVENLKGDFTDRVLFKRKDGVSLIYYKDKGVLFWFEGDKIYQMVVYQQDSAKDKTNSTKIYAVNRSVNEFDQKEDFSKPEAAYASINRISASGESAGWQRASVKELAAKLAEENERGKNEVEPEWAKVLLNSKILEVRICDGNTAVVIAQLPQEFSSKPIQQPIDVRYLKLEDGKWLNTGNDRVWTIEEARAMFCNLCEKSQARAKQAEKTGSTDGEMN